MRYRPRPILTAAEHRELADRRRELQREGMTPGDIGKLMRKVANEALDRNGVVEEADFLRANLPPDAVKARARAVIMEVVDERAHGGIHA